MKNSVLILGSNGRFGRNAAEAFESAGWKVTRFNRATDDLQAAAQGKDVIVHSWNPLYPDWAKQVPALTKQVVAAAKTSGATVLIPGNVYIYGAQSDGNWTDSAPTNAQNPMGKIRIQMEATFRDAKIPTIILRSGDYIDIEASGNWFDKIIAAKASKGILSYPGELDADRNWAFLPDIAKAAVQLCEMRADLEPFQQVLYPGLNFSAIQLAQTAQLISIGKIRLKKFAWWPIRLLQPFWAMARSLNEMSYLWSLPHRLDGTTLARLLPNHKPQTLAQVLPQTGLFDVNPNQTMG